MGQVALGFRSLLFKLAVFTVMAAMLAWILGGTLFPRPVMAIQKDLINVGAWTFGWEVEIQPEHGTLNWYLARYRELDYDAPWERVPGGGPFAAVEPLQAGTASDEPDVLFTIGVWLHDDVQTRVDLAMHRDAHVELVQRAAEAN